MLRWVSLWPGVPPVTAFATTQGQGTPIVVDAETGVAYYLSRTGEVLPLAAGAVRLPDDGRIVLEDAGTPVIPWERLSLLGPGLPTPPALAAYRAGLRGWAMTVADSLYFALPLPQAYLPAGDLWLQFFWSHNATTVTGGTVTWGLEASYAEPGAAFPAPITATVAQAASTTQYSLLRAELALSAASPSGSQLDSDDLSPGGVLQGRIYLSANGLTVSGGGTPDPFLHAVDLLFPSRTVGTVSR